LVGYGYGVVKMKPRIAILAALDAGKTPNQICRKFSRNTVYKYYRLWLALKIRDKIQAVIDTGAWEWLYISQLQELKTEMEKWREY